MDAIRYTSQCRLRGEKSNHRVMTGNDNLMPTITPTQITAAAVAAADANVQQHITTSQVVDDVYTSSSSADAAMWPR